MVIQLISNLTSAELSPLKIVHNTDLKMNWLYLYFCLKQHNISELSLKQFFMSNDFSKAIFVFHINIYGRVFNQYFYNFDWIQAWNMCKIFSLVPLKYLSPEKTETN